MSVKNISERTCVICRTKKPKDELSRFLVEDGKVKFDKSQRGLRRGFYICSKDCWEAGTKKNRRVKISSRENKFVTLPDVAPEGIVW